MRKVNGTYAVAVVVGSLAGGAVPDHAQSTPVAAGPVPLIARADERVLLGGLLRYTLGRPDAPLTIVEFTDLQCASCREFHVTTFRQIKKEYIDTGRLRYFSFDFPSDALHPRARKAALAVRCAGDQGYFWEMRDGLLSSAAEFDADLFTAMARDLKMEPKTFDVCVRRDRFAAEIQKDYVAGAAMGVQSTPTFIIGRTTSDGVDGVWLVGAAPFPVFDAKIRELLGKRGRD